MPASQPHVTLKDLEKDLRSLGLAAGDIVLTHSSLASIGHIDGGAATLLQAFLNVLTKKGTFVVPIFGDLGVLTKTVAAHPAAVKSVHPIAAVAAIGPKASQICADHWKAPTAHAHDTPYLRIADLGGYVLLLGVDQDRNTTLHSVESLLRGPYLKTTSVREFDTPEGKVAKSWELFPGPHRDFIRCDQVLRASGKMKTGSVGKAVARLIKSRDLIEVMTTLGASQPDWALCDNPSCADCVSQRASLSRFRLNQETFHLAASSALAGRYVPEMIENLRASGIDAIELDVIQERPAYLLDEKKLRKHVDQLKEEGVKVTALRVPAILDSHESLFATLKAVGVPRVVLPLTTSATETARAAEAMGLETSFYNVATDSLSTSRLLENMAGKGLSPRFAFNARNFAAAGEKPFLTSYKRKLRRFVVQLDVEDGAFDGHHTPLAMGNAEIKEMISILRCASFDGWLVLRGCPGTEPLRDTTKRFRHLLDTM